MSKRGRDDDTSWDEFVSSVRSKIEKKYEQVNTIQSAPLSISIFMPTSSRIPIGLFSLLRYENYFATFTVSVTLLQRKENLRVQVSYSTKSVKFSENTSELMLQSPKGFLQNNLQLKNKETVEAVDRLIKVVFKKFPKQMNWVGVPYQMIYFKKHNQIILRFKFTGDVIPFTNDVKDECLKSSWMEYNTKSKNFHLVNVLENCC